MNAAASLHAGRVMAMASIIVALVIACSSACGSSSTRAIVASPTPVVASTTPDSITRNYVALAHEYWIQYKAEADGEVVCFGGSVNDVKLVDPPTCRASSVAMVAVHEKFLSDLDSNPPPARFARDDQAFRSQLPIAIADMNEMISIAETGNRDAVLSATTVYVDAMIPIVTHALDDVDPFVVHI